MVNGKTLRHHDDPVVDQILTAVEVLKALHKGDVIDRYLQEMRHSMMVVASTRYLHEWSHSMMVVASTRYLQEWRHSMMVVASTR